MDHCSSIVFRWELSTQPSLVYDAVPSDIGFNSVLKMYHTLAIRIVVWFLDTYVTLSILSGWVDVSNGGERIVNNTKSHLHTKERNSYTFLHQADRPKIGVYMS